jgi:hypothetical protein
LFLKDCAKDRERQPVTANPSPQWFALPAAGHGQARQHGLIRYEIALVHQH